MPFTGTTTSSDQYKAPPQSAYYPQAANPSTPVGTPNQNPRIRFEGTTTNREFYKPHAITFDPPAGLTDVSTRATEPMPDDRTFETTNKAAYRPPEASPTSGVEIEADREGRLRVYVDRGASVADLKKVLEELTAIPTTDQVAIQQTAPPRFPLLSISSGDSAICFPTSSYTLLPCVPRTYPLILPLTLLSAYCAPSLHLLTPPSSAPPSQHLVRLQDGRELYNENQRLVTELGWNSGEELTLTNVKKATRQQH